MDEEEAGLGKEEAAEPNCSAIDPGEEENVVDRARPSPHERKSAERCHSGLLGRQPKRAERHGGKAMGNDLRGPDRGVVGREHVEELVSRKGKALHERGINRGAAPLNDQDQRRASFNRRLSSALDLAQCPSAGNGSPWQS